MFLQIKCKLILLHVFNLQELEALQTGLEKKASLSSNDAKFIGLQVG